MERTPSIKLPAIKRFQTVSSRTLPKGYRIRHRDGALFVLSWPIPDAPVLLQDGAEM